MDIRLVDSSATRGSSLLHRSAPAVKLLAFVALLTAVVASTNVLIVIGLALGLLGVAAASRLPMRAVMALAAYPGLFAALFAFAAAADFLIGVLVVAKAVTAALAAVILLFTTPYPQVFAPMQRLLPPLLGDALLMTYRSLFLLLERFGHVATAAKLRAGLVGASPVRTARTLTRSLAAVLLYSVDLSQRTYDVMHLRGYEGRLVVSSVSSAPKAAQAAVLVVALTAGAMALLWRRGGETLAPYAWLPLLAGAAVLAVGLLARMLRTEVRS